MTITINKKDNKKEVTVKLNWKNLTCDTSNPSQRCTSVISTTLDQLISDQDGIEGRRFSTVKSDIINICNTKVLVANNDSSSYSHNVGMIPMYPNVSTNKLSKVSSFHMKGRDTYIVNLA